MRQDTNPRAWSGKKWVRWLLGGTWYFVGGGQFLRPRCIHQYTTWTREPQVGEVQLKTETYRTWWVVGGKSNGQMPEM